MSQLAMVIEESDKERFEFKLHDALMEGYKLSSSSCGFVNDTKYDYCGLWQAILYKEKL